VTSPSFHHLGDTYPIRRPVQTRGLSSVNARGQQSVIVREAIWRIRSTCDVFRSDFVIAGGHAADAGKSDEGSSKLHEPLERCINQATEFLSLIFVQVLQQPSAWARLHLYRVYCFYHSRCCFKPLRSSRWASALSPQRLFNHTIPWQILLSKRSSVMPHQSLDTTPKMTPSVLHGCRNIRTALNSFIVRVPNVPRGRLQRPELQLVF
jgi:hypothetical protein